MTPLLRQKDGQLMAWAWCTGIHLLFLSISHGLAEPSPHTLFHRVIQGLMVTLWFWVGWRGGHSFYGLSRPIVWIHGLYLAWMTFRAWNAPSPDLAWRVVEDHFWFQLTIMSVVDLARAFPLRCWLSTWWRLALLIGLSYAAYQLIVIFPMLKERAAALSMEGGGVLDRRFLIRLRSDEVFGLRLYPNLFGLLCAMAMVSLKPFRLKSDFLLWTLALALLIQSGSKGPWLGLLAVMLFMGVGKMRSRQSCLYGGGAMAMAFVVLYWFWPTLEAHFWPSIQVRLGYWQGAWAMALDHPFGIGGLNFGQLYSQYMGPEATEVQLAHSDVLQILVEQGWVGLGLQILFWLCLWHEARGVGASTCTENGGRDEVNAPALGTASKVVSALSPTVAWERSWSAVVPMVFVMFYLAMSSEFLNLGPLDLETGSWSLWLIWIAGVLYWSRCGRERNGDGRYLIIVFLWMSCIDFPNYDIFLLMWVTVLVMTQSYSMKSGFDSRRDLKGHLSSKNLAIGKASELKGRLFSVLDRYRVKMNPKVKKSLVLGWMLAILWLTIFWISHHQQLVLWRQQLLTMEGQSPEEWDLDLLFASDDLDAWEAFLAFLETRMDSKGRQPLEVSYWRRCLDRLIELKPRHAGTWDRWAQSRLDEHDQLKGFQMATKLHPFQPRFAYHLGLQYLVMDDPHQARFWLDRALSRHRQALSLLKEIPDMELHLLQHAEFKKATTVY